jgi:hypothetical protein
MLRQHPAELTMQPARWMPWNDRGTLAEFRICLIRGGDCVDQKENHQAVILRALRRYGPCTAHGDLSGSACRSTELKGKQVNVGRVSLYECQTCGHLMPTKSIAMSRWRFDSCWASCTDPRWNLRTRRDRKLLAVRPAVSYLLLIRLFQLVAAEGHIVCRQRIEDPYRGLC